MNKGDVNLKVIISESKVRVVYNEEDLSYRDKSIYKDNQSGVFVYGYPYSVIEKRWLKAADIYTMYKSKGDEFLNEIDGSFAILYYDKRNNLVRSFIDPYKTYTFYYKVNRDFVVISDSLTEIVEYSGEYKLNEIALLEFLHFGFVIGTKTIFEDIATFPPGSLASINSLLELSVDYYMNYRLMNKEFTKEDFFNEFNGHMEIIPYLSDNASLPLTGGLDSRVVLSSSLNFKENLNCYTHGLDNSEDVKIAKQISESLQLNHSHYNELGEEFINEIPNISKRLTNNFEGMLNSVLFSHLERSYNKEAELSDTFLTGIAGEMFRYFYLPADYKYKDLDDLSLLLKDRLLVNRNYGIYTSNSGDVSEVLINSIKQELESYDSTDPVYLTDLFYLKNRIGNFASYNIRLIGKKFNVFNPYLSKDLVTIALNLNRAEKNKGVQDFVIKKNSEILSNIPVSDGRFINKNLKAISFNMTSKYITYFKKAVNKLTKKNIFSFYFVNYPEWLRKHHSSFIRTELSFSELEVKDIIDEELFKEHIDKFLNGKVNLSYQLTNLLSLQLYLKSIE